MKTIQSKTEEKDICDKTIKEYEKMVGLGLLKPGKHFTKDHIEYILETKYEPNDWTFLGRYLTLKALIEYKGFFITQGGLEPPEFRILETNEMAEHGMRKLKKAAHINLRVNHVMSTHDSSKLNDREKKVYDSVVNRAASIAIYQQKALLEDFHF